MSYSQKYTLVQLLEPMNEGDVYVWTDWPLHVTIADVFAVDWDNDNLLQKLSDLLARHKVCSAIADHDEYFGPEKQTQVTILDMSQELIDLHNDIVALLKSHGAVFNNPQYTGSGFRAHSTVQSHGHLQKGDIVRFDALTIIDMFPDQDPYKRKVLKTFKLLG